MPICLPIVDITTAFDSLGWISALRKAKVGAILENDRDEDDEEESAKNGKSTNENNFASLFSSAWNSEAKQQSCHAARMAANSDSHKYPTHRSTVSMLQIGNN